MLGRLLAAVTAFIVSVISAGGYTGIVVLMAIESACIPLPSEIIMPFAGYLVYRGELGLTGVAVAGAAGCVLGSLVAYAVGARGGRPAIERWGRFVLLGHRELELAERWFARWGRQTVFWARLLPVVRTFIALPAGIARMELWPPSAFCSVPSTINPADPRMTARLSRKRSGWTMACDIPVSSSSVRKTNPLAVPGRCRQITFPAMRRMIPCWALGRSHARQVSGRLGRASDIGCGPVVRPTPL